ncbi:hypothetical protein ACRRTK_012001 [Alexandromys fortis]
MFNVVFGKGRHGERRRRGLFGRGLWGCWLLVQFSSIISCSSITEGAVSNDKNKVQKPEECKGCFPTEARKPEWIPPPWGSRRRPHLGDALQSALAGGRARGSPGSPSGAGRDHSAATERVDVHERAWMRGRRSPAPAVAAATAIVPSKWREDGLCGASGRLEGGGRLSSSLPSLLLALDAPGSGLPLGPALMGEPRSKPRQLARAAGEAGPRGSPPPPRPVPSPSGPLRSAGRLRLCAPLPGAAAAAGLGSPRTRSAERAVMPERDRRQPIGGRHGREPSLRTGQRDEGRRR